MSILAELNWIDRIIELNAMPKIAMDLMGLLGNPDTPVKDVIDEIQLDSAIASYILKYCNSPLVMMRTQVNSIRQAVNLIGYARCRSLLMSYFTRNLYNISGKKYLTDYLFEHSLSVAIIARDLAGFLGFGERREEAYLSGLLHDIGKLVLYYHDLHNYEKLMIRADRERRPYIALEERQYKYTHVETGYYLMTKWGFSEYLKTSLRYHHNWEGYHGKDKLVNVTAFANATCHYAIDKQEGIPAGFLEHYGLSIEDYHEILDTILHSVAQTHLVHLDMEP